MKPVTPFDNYPSFGNAGARQAPGDAKYALGFVAADTFPAEWANYFFHGATKGVSDLNTAVRSIWVELENILNAYGITAEVSEESQLLTAIGKIYPKITTCSTGASTQNKSLAITGNVLKAGDVYVITMTYGNTYGDGSLTYPTLSINGGTAYPICDASGNYLGDGAWEDGETIKVLFTGSRYLMATQSVVDLVEKDNMHPVTSNAVETRCTHELIWDGSNWTPSGGSAEQLNFTHEISENSILLIEVKPYINSSIDELVTFTVPLSSLIHGVAFKFTGRRISGSSGSYTWMDWGWKLSVGTTTYILRGNGISQQYNDGGWGVPYRIWLVK